MGFSGRAGWGNVREMRGLRAVLAGGIWAAAMAAAGEGIPLYREWDTAVRFDGMESGEVGIDEAMRLELRAGPLREGITGKEVLVDLSDWNRKGVSMVGGVSAWQADTTGGGGESKKKDDDWILSAIRQADGSSSNRTSLAEWLAGDGEGKNDGWGWLAGGVQAEAEGRAAEAEARQVESQAWEVEVGNTLSDVAERRRGGESGRGGAEGAGRRGTGEQEGWSRTSDSINGAEGDGNGGGVSGSGGWRMADRSWGGTGDGAAEGTSRASQGEGEGGEGEMSRTRAALEMAGMKTEEWKSAGGDRRFATSGLGVDWKNLTGGATGTPESGSGRNGGGTGNGPETTALSGWSLPKGPLTGGWGGMGEEGTGNLAWQTGVKAEAVSGAGSSGMGERERWGGGWVVGASAGGWNGGGNGLGGGGFSGAADSGVPFGTGGGGVSVPAQRSGGGAAWEAWQKRGENSGGGFTPVWR